MKTKHFKTQISCLLFFIFYFSPHFVHANEKVIQEEEMSYERCVNVISVSADKLSIAPVISDKKEKVRIAVFKLSDGTLTITCDGAKNLLTVSTNTN